VESVGVSSVPESDRPDLRTETVDADVVSASLIENWIDETERRVSFLNETTREHREKRL
jgi:hypothetical protein